VKPGLTRNRALFSVLGNRVFFCPRAKVLKDSQCHARIFLVVGKKYDITEDLQPYLQKRYRVKEGGK
jgi:hypothetical protein